MFSLVNSTESSVDFSNTPALTASGFLVAIQPLVLKAIESMISTVWHGLRGHPSDVVFEERRLQELSNNETLLLNNITAVPTTQPLPRQSLSTLEPTPMIAESERNSLKKIKKSYIKYLKYFVYLMFSLVGLIILAVGLSCCGCTPRSIKGNQIMPSPPSP